MISTPPKKTYVSTPGTFVSNTVYVAATDGIVTAWTNALGIVSVNLAGYAHKSNANLFGGVVQPVARSHMRNMHESGEVVGISFPVQKGGYWGWTGRSDSMVFFHEIR